jgi:hypothetical protein
MKYCRTEDEKKKIVDGTGGCLPRWGPEMNIRFASSNLSDRWCSFPSASLSTDTGRNLDKPPALGFNGDCLQGKSCAPHADIRLRDFGYPYWWYCGYLVPTTICRHEYPEKCGDYYRVCSHKMPVMNSKFTWNGCGSVKLLVFLHLQRVNLAHYCRIHMWEYEQLDVESLTTWAF